MEVLVVRGRVKCTVRRYGGARTGSGLGGWSGGEGVGGGDGEGKLEGARGMRSGGERGCRDYFFDLIFIN